MSNLASSIGLMTFRLLEAIQYLVQEMPDVAKEAVEGARRELEKVRATYVIPEETIKESENYLKLAERYIDERNLNALIGAARFAVWKLSEHLS